MQELLSKESDAEMAEYFIKEICNIDPNIIPPSEQIKAFKTWYSKLEYSQEVPPSSFKVNGKKLSLPIIEFKGKEVDNLLNIKLGYLIELVNLDIDLEKFKGIDNVAALLYREDWDKPFDVQEYIDTAVMFESLPCKYSLYGMTKYNELILTLKNTYPILYEDNEEGKTDGTKLTELLIAASGDNPSNFDQARNAKVSDVFTWMVEKKKKYINEKLKMQKQRR